MNFSADLNKRLFSVTERAACNMKGKGKLDPEKEITLRMFPLENKETKTASWKACVTAINEVNQGLNEIKKPTE